MKLDNAVSAVITGGASGLGEATARALAAQGVKVALFDLNEEKGEAIARELGGVFCKVNVRSEEHTSELQSLMRISYAVFCLKKKKTQKYKTRKQTRKTKARVT